MNIFTQHIEVPFNELQGQTLVNITVPRSNDTTPDKVVFETVLGTKYLMYHDQQCCEMVYLEDICGDVQDIIGSPIISAEQVDSPKDPGKKDPDDESYTWTFYKLSTFKGSVTFRWYGTSNGYYSKSVQLYRSGIDKGKDLANNVIRVLDRAKQFVRQHPDSAGYFATSLNRVLDDMMFNEVFNRDGSLDVRGDQSIARWTVSELQPDREYALIHG